MEEPAYTYQSPGDTSADEFERARQRGLGVFDAALDIVTAPYKSKLADMELQNARMALKLRELQDLLHAKDLTIDSLTTQIAEKDALIATLQKPSSHTNAFTNLIQVKDKQKVLAWLHSHIDGRKGKEVAVAIMKLFQERVITAIPSEKVFRSEFTLIGRWRSISKYLTLDLQSVSDAVKQLRFSS